MSYILDALKKAEHERNLGSVPNLHAQLVMPALMAKQSRPRRRFALLALALTAVVLFALLLWFRPWSKDAVYTMTITTAQADPSAHPAPVAPAIMRAAPPLPRPENPPVKSPPAKLTVPVAAPAEETPKKTEEAIAALRELPESIQRQIPALTVHGYIYADQAADRSIIINHKLLREGDQVAPDLLLEKLTPGGMILNFRGYRYRTSY